jgi:hypothetical protein
MTNRAKICNLVMNSRNLIMVRIGSILFFLLLSLSSFCQFQNLMIGDSNYPEEPSLAISPKNPAVMVAGSNIDNYYYSGDGGLTWQAGILSSAYGVWGDPCIIADTIGNFYFFHLSNPPGGNFIDRIVCQKSIDGGQTWTSESYTGLNGSKDQDKEWAVVDPNTNNIYVCWTQFDQYQSTNPLDSSNILFSRSVDGGVTWSASRRINQKAGDCLDQDNTVEGAVPAVGPAGEIYVAWAGSQGIVFNRSLDQGNTWLDVDIFISDIPGGWDYAIPGIYRANGLPVTCCDLSKGPHRGNIYINWSDQRNGNFDTDVWFIRSTDGGLHWDERKRVNNDPPGKQQFLTWMTVDQSTGFIYFVFYDRRAYDDDRTDVYLAVSRDGGETFENIKLSDTPFLPHASVFFGDYTNISAEGNVVRPIWARLNGNELSVWTALADSIVSGTGRKEESILALDQNYPNPVKDFTCIAYKVHRATTVSLMVCDLFGREVAVLTSKKWVSPGKYVEYFDAARSGLPPGIYYFSLINDEQILRKKMVIQ